MNIIIVMNRLFVISVFVPMYLVLIADKSVIAESKNHNEQSSNVSSSKKNLPVCYIQKADGTYLDLSHICGKSQKRVIEQTETKDECLPVLPSKNINDEYLRLACQ